MTTINLINGYYIEIDPLNHTLKQKYIGKTKKGEEKEFEKVCGYFGNLSQAIGKFLKLNNLGVTDDLSLEFSEYVKMIEDLNKMAVRAIESVVRGAENG